MSGRTNMHAWVANVRLAIAGDLAAAQRYDEAGRHGDAAAARESAAWWTEQISARLHGRRFHGGAQ